MTKKKTYKLEELQTDRNKRGLLGLLSGQDLDDFKKDFAKNFKPKSL